MMLTLASTMTWLVMLASPTAGSPPEGLTPAERGLWFLLNKSYMATDVTDEQFAELWRVWPQPLRSEAERKTPEERRQMAYARYGHIAMPGRDVPMGFVKDESGGWRMNCLVCHGGKVAGQAHPGLPNTHFAFQTWASDIVNYRVTRENMPRSAFLNSLVIPLNRSNGTTNAQIFSVVLTTLRDDNLTFTPPKGRAPPKMLHHDLDAPPFWHLKHKKMLYIDGFVEKSPRVIMQFVLLPTNSGETIKSWENDFRDILAFAESVTPPKYPWPIDEKLAGKGEVVFAEHCASCHGVPGQSYPEKRIPIDEVGTDRRRLDGMPLAHRRFFQTSWMSEEGTVEVVEEPGGYVAPPLEGLWASAPYLHNGSVPTLWHLMNPENRPKVWRRDEEGYDQERTGLLVTEYAELPAEVKGADERRQFFDTRQAGKSAAGHDFPNALSQEEKEAVIEYLKGK